MASSAVLDFSTLLAPVAADSPAGESLRYSGIYDAIQEARRAEDDLPMGDWQREVKAADWRAVIALATGALATKSKDLQIAVWLAEALVKQFGLAGLRDGARLLRELQEHFWEGLYPEIEDGDLEFRAGPLEWLNQKLPSCVKDIPLIAGEPAYGWRHWEESRQVDNLGRQSPDAMAAAVAEGKITGEQFEKEVAATPRSFYESLFEDLNESREELSKLESVIDQNFGRNAPSLLAIRKAVEDCQGVVQGLLKNKREQDPNYRPESGNGAAALRADEPGAPAGSAVAWSGEPKSREEAFQRLASIAAYLKRVEPQHPVSYLLERAVRWTKMPLEEWLGEVIHSDEVLAHLRDTLGIKS